MQIRLHQLARIAQQVAKTFGPEIDKYVVRRVEIE